MKSAEYAFKQRYRNATIAERREIKDHYLDLYTDSTFAETAVRHLRWLREVETGEAQTA